MSSGCGAQRYPAMQLYYVLGIRNLSLTVIFATNKSPDTVHPWALSNPSCPERCPTVTP